MTPDVQWKAAGAAVVLVGLWAAFSAGPRRTVKVSMVGSEDVQQLNPQPGGLPSDFVQWSPVSWAGRTRGYPGAAGAGITTLIYKGPPNWADDDGTGWNG